MKVKFKTNIGVGASSILMIFVVLCMTTFGILSFVTANADLKLTNANEAMITAYYHADAQAETTLSDVDRIVAALQKDLQSDQVTATQYLGQVEQQLNQLKFLTDVSLDESRVKAEFTYPVTDTKSMIMVVEILAQENEDRYRVTHHSLMDQEAESQSDTLNVWKG